RSRPHGPPRAHRGAGPCRRARAPGTRQDPEMTDPSSGTGPAAVDLGALVEDAPAELRRCAARHWWAQSVDQDGRPTPVVLGWEANRDVLADRRLSPISFVDDMLASGLSPATAAQIAPLFGRHGAEHRHLRAVLASAFTPRKVEQLRP